MKTRILQHAVCHTFFNYLENAFRKNQGSLYSAYDYGKHIYRNAISRNRLKRLFSKLQFNEPSKTQDASSICYRVIVMDCLRKTFIEARSDSSLQFIDELVAEFKGRSSLKHSVSVWLFRRVWRPRLAAIAVCYVPLDTMRSSVL